jgi:hypothetical protein
LYIFGLTDASSSRDRSSLNEGEMMREMWWSLLLLPALAGGCAGLSTEQQEEKAHASVGICFDASLPAGSPSAAGSDVERRNEIARQLAQKGVELVGWLGASAEAGGAPKLEWQEPRELEGVQAAEAPPHRPADAPFGYSFERAPLHVTVIETADPMASNSEAHRWLMEDLSLAKQPWKVVILSRPIVSPSPVRVDEERIALADLLAREGVALAIAAGGPEQSQTGGAAYFRTARIGEARQDSVRYVILGAGGSTEPAGPAEAGKPAPPAGKPPPDWTALTITQPCFCVLDAKKSRLRWEVFDLQGRLLDFLEAAAGEGSGSQAQIFSWSEVLRSKGTE